VRPILPLFTLLACCAVQEILAAEVTPFVEARRIGIALSAMEFPQSLPRELRSGLTNRVLIRISLLADSRRIDQRGVEIAVRYDLWDENFRVTTRIDGAVTGERTYARIEEVLALLGNLRLPGLFATGDLKGQPPFVLRADALLNPIDRERLDNIRRWVAETTTPGTATSATGASTASANAASNAIFNRIFEQYAAGTDMAASWNQTVSSRPFRPDDLARDGQ
jgi:hypothetical protein